MLNIFSHCTFYIIYWMFLLHINSSTIFAVWARSFSSCIHMQKAAPHTSTFSIVLSPFSNARCKVRRMNLCVHCTVHVHTAFAIATEHIHIWWCLWLCVLVRDVHIESQHLLLCIHTALKCVEFLRNPLQYYNHDGEVLHAKHTCMELTTTILIL